MNQDLNVRVERASDDTSRKQQKIELVEECIFCRIISKKLAATVVAENDLVIAIKDLYPQAPIHILLIPKKHRTDIGAFTQDDSQMAGALLMMAQKISTSDPRAAEFRLVSNNGPKSGQVIFHTHIHFLAGRDFKEIA